MRARQARRWSRGGGSGVVGSLAFSGMRIRRLPAIPREFARRRSPDLQIRLVEIAGDLAESKNAEIFQRFRGSDRRRLEPAIFRRRHTRGRLEGAVERTER